MSLATRPRGFSICLRCTRQLRAPARFSSTTTEAAPSPLLAKMKTDIKTAMRAKDTTRLNVLRAIISETNQLSSGSSPIRTDLQLLALLKKRRSASVAAASEAEKHGRNDLKEKQEQEMQVLDEYAGTVKMMGTEELKETVTQAISGLGNSGSLQHGQVMKELLKPGGALDGKPIDKKELSQIVQAAIAA